MARYIGFHINTSGRLEDAVVRAYTLRATAFSVFLGAPVRWRRAKIDDDATEKFRSDCRRYGFTPSQVAVHSNYLMNLGHPDDLLLRRSRGLLTDEVRCCEKLGIGLINFHPGNHLGKISDEDCLNRIADSVNLVIGNTRESCMVIEGTAGQGNDLGFSFEQLAHIVNLVEDKTRIGVCLDTCHAFAAGYDLRDSSRCERVFEELGRIVGYDYLQMIHLNNTRHGLGQRVDRHQPPHCGVIDDSALAWIIEFADRRSIPIIIESDPRREELDWLRSLTSSTRQESCADQNSE